MRQDKRQVDMEGTHVVDSCAHASSTINYTVSGKYESHTTKPFEAECIVTP